MGAQVGEQQAQMQFREQEAARQAQQFAQEQEMAKAKMAAMTQEQQQKQQLEEKYFTMASKSAADKGAAMLSYQQDIAGGTDATQAALKWFPQMGYGTGDAQIIHAQLQAKAAEQRQADATQRRKDAASRPMHVGHQIVDPSTGEVVFDADSANMSMVDKTAHARAVAEIKSAEAALAKPTVGAFAEQQSYWEKRLNAAEKKANEIESKYPDATPPRTAPRTGTGAPRTPLAAMAAGARPPATATQLPPPPQAPAPAALPMPKSKADAIVGKLYQTKKGPAVWDGQGFVLQQSPDAQDTAPDEGSPDER
jgi:hypothetical protein